MKENADNAYYKDRSLFLSLIGVLLLAAGIVAAFMGPIETYCFYFFSEGGRFHYEGFGFGSFMFGNIAVQIIGYYLIAIVLIPLGYGHLKIRRWARQLALTLLWFWLVVGLPLIIVFYFILITAKDLSLAVGLIWAIILLSSYLVIPGFFIRFYGGRNLRLTFEAKDPRSYWIETRPVPVLVLAALYLFYLIVLHVPILFNGLFPFFGVWLSGLQGIFLLDVLILGLAALIWGTLSLSRWAWWGSLFYFGALAFSSILTFFRSSYLDILLRQRFPPTEMEALDGLPFQGFHFALFFGVPLFLTLGLIIFSKRYFGGDHQVASVASGSGHIT